MLQALSHISGYVCHLGGTQIQSQRLHVRNIGNGHLDHGLGRRELHPLHATGRVTAMARCTPLGIQRLARRRNRSRSRSRGGSHALGHEGCNIGSLDRTQIDGQRLHIRNPSDRRLHQDLRGRQLHPLDPGRRITPVAGSAPLCIGLLTRRRITRDRLRPNLTPSPQQRDPHSHRQGRTCQKCLEVVDHRDPWELVQTCNRGLASLRPDLAGGNCPKRT